MLGDISWTGWSSIPLGRYHSHFGDADVRGRLVAQKLDTKFDDAWRFAMGANYKLDEAWKLRFGIAYDQTPVPNAEYRLTSLPDNDRTWFSAGFQYKPAKNMAVDFGARLYLPGDAEINNDQRCRQGQGPGQGQLRQLARCILGSQLSMTF